MNELTVYEWNVLIDEVAAAIGPPTSTPDQVARALESMPSLKRLMVNPNAANDAANAARALMIQRRDRLLTIAAKLVTMRDQAIVDEVADTFGE